MGFYFQNGLASSTQKAYNSAKKQYILFCGSSSLIPLPASESQLYHKCYLAAIRYLHIAEGYGDPNISSMARLEQVLKGIKSVQAKGHKRVPQLPITPNRLVKMKEVWDKLPNTFDGNMLWAASSLCFFGFLRLGEIIIPSDSSYDKGAHLNYEDVAVDRLH